MEICMYACKLVIVCKYLYVCAHKILRFQLFCILVSQVLCIRYVGLIIHHHRTKRYPRPSFANSPFSFLASGRSSGLHPVSSQTCCIYVRAARPVFAQPYVRDLLLHRYPACLVRLTWIVFMMGGRWPYSWCIVGCYLQDLFNIARSILVKLPSSFFSSRFVSVQVVHPYNSIDVTTAWKKQRFILSVSSDFHMIDSLSIAVHAFVSRESMSFSVDETA